MKKSLCMTRRSFCAACALPLVSLSAAPTLPRKAPDYSVRMTNGQFVYLKQFLGKVVVLEVLLTTCPHCQRCARTMQSVLDEYASRGVVVIGSAINDDARADLLSFLMKTGAKFPIGLGDRNATYSLLQADMSAGPVYMPQLVFIDQQGMIRAQYAGTDNFFLEEEKNVRAELEKLLKPASAKGARS